ncbi:hypothetical protein OHB00_39120 [Streptomyces sp. NBC_00631]|uniref:hypothetical protein n=1 Tax=Streptomyces sp. NBC_00631 TaxID=2975793 RepID=UPI0030E108DF
MDCDYCHGRGWCPYCHGGTPRPEREAKTNQGSCLQTIGWTVAVMAVLSYFMSHTHEQHPLDKLDDLRNWVTGHLPHLER